MLDRLEALGVVGAGGGVEALGWVEPQLVGEGRVAIEQLVEGGVADLGLAGAVGGLVVADLAARAVSSSRSLGWLMTTGM